MTVDQIVGASLEELKAMTDAQMLEHFKPVLHITRPELAAKQATVKKTGMSSGLIQKQAEVLAMMKSMGMELPL